jgi:1-acyl-sn-glycerol-3-phosphate acyltransferase
MLRALARAGLIVLVFLMGTPLVLVSSWLPLRPRQAKIGNWIVVIGARIILWALDVRLVVHNADRLKRHQGFIFPNHYSALDVLLLAALTPVRFLSKAEIRTVPFIGWIAVAIDTVFVQREEKESRVQARNVLLDTPRYPPIALFPEGAILLNDEWLNPFRYGAFEIAQQSQTPYIPCALRYEQRQLVHWGDESMVSNIWRIARRPPGKLTVELVLLHVVHPRQDDDPQLLALEAHGAMLAVLRQDEKQQVIMEEGI